MKVLITGALGELGADLCPQLAREFELRRTDLRAEMLVEGDDYLRADLTRPEQLPRLLEGVEAVVHLAALLPHGYTPAEFMDANAKATTLLAAASAEAGVRRFVYASTIWATGRGQQEGYLPVDEKAPWRPICMYGHSKLLGELGCEFYARNCGLSVVVLRLCGYHRQAAARPEGDIDWAAADLTALAQDAVMPGQRLFDPADLGAAFLAALRAEAPSSLTGATALTGDVQFRRYLIGLDFPFAAEDAAELCSGPLSVLDRYYPGAREMAEALGWEPRPIDRYHDVSRAKRELGFRAGTDLGDVIAEFRRRGSGEL